MRICYGISVACLVMWLMGGFYVGLLTAAICFALLGWVFSR